MRDILADLKQRYVSILLVRQDLRVNPERDHRMFSKTKAMSLVISSVPKVTHEMIEVVWIPLCNDSQVEYSP